MVKSELGDSIVWHSLTIEDVYKKLSTGPDGLTGEEASKRLQQYGPNSLPVRKPPGIFRIFLSQFKSPLIYILLIAALFSFILMDYKDGFFILFVVVLNALIGMVQEWKAEQSASRLKGLLRISAHVHRDKKTVQIDASKLVPGDLVMLRSGIRVPADLRLVHASNIQIDESLLTGESVAVEKEITILEDNVPVSDRKNMAFGGTVVMTGRGAGIVTATGIKTEVGMIAKVLAAAGVTKPPLLIRMEKFSRDIGFIVIGACSLMAIVSLSRGTPVTDVFFLAVALAVSAIPEGLPVAITVALSIAASRMGKRNVIVRNLTAVESLGSCTMIATDKTGTLTVNEQMVKRVILPSGDIFDITGAGYVGEGEILLLDGEHPGPSQVVLLQNLALNAAICNEGSLFLEEGSWVHDGDEMDVALLSFGYKAGVEPDRIHNDIRIMRMIPYEPKQRYSLVYYTDESGIIRVSAKGAYEVLLQYCYDMQAGGTRVPLEKKKTDEHLRLLTQNGYRVLAIAKGTLEEMPKGSLELEEVCPPLTYLGIIGFIDPIRPNVREAIRMCKKAGVDVAMITGDHPETSFTIGRELGLADEKSAVVTGSELDAIESLELPEFFERISMSRIFARVSPVQKLLIVDGMVKNGHFVAVTGDGVNDAPALKKANIGVAMGSGTDVAKDSASMIITDDDFSSIVAGIEEGRFAYDNIRKVTYLLISTGFAEIILFTLALFVGLPLPLLAVQLLWINLVTNGIQDVALAFEAGEPEAMKRKPRNPKEGVFNSLMIQETIIAGTIIGLIAFAAYVLLISEGWDEYSARNVVVLLMVLLENAHALNCRSEYRSLFSIPLKNNYYLIFGIVVAQGIHILAMMTPFMQDLLDIEAVSLHTWISLLAIASLIIVSMEVFKYVKFQNKQD
ncbi:HAD-IC family P-type ATPase [Methanoplanus sp. FWC-SCC4]|uniref:HAD-IC family P-type ATPase n=1 Tax=Methanochimaera problematica TaxID=2609417 RepID=A0AA97I2M6_9EURY|nr:HAD-IC family P-type ATPase [Methanoplanus sp. FWC-SCC4]WOF16440.1 HAD-IC family P-type ATPase [Methanoplanus sp. FWC-SCC4]